MTDRQRWVWQSGRLFEIERNVRCEVDFTGLACCLECHLVNGSMVLVRADVAPFCLTCRNRKAMHDFRDWICDNFKASR